MQKEHQHAVVRLQSSLPRITAEADLLSHSIYDRRHALPLHAFTLSLWHHFCIFIHIPQPFLYILFYLLYIFTLNMQTEGLIFNRSLIEKQVDQQSTCITTLSKGFYERAKQERTGGWSQRWIIANPQRLIGALKSHDCFRNANSCCIFFSSSVLGVVCACRIEQNSDMVQDIRKETSD